MGQYVTPVQTDAIKGPRSQVCFPIMKEFIESGHRCVVVERRENGERVNPQLLRWYAKRHNLPVWATTRAQDVYLVRRDIAEDGSKIENWEQEVDEDDADEVFNSLLGRA